MERARATGAFTDYQRAEKLARWSLAIRTTRNGATFGLLASALLARHEFKQALAVAQWADSMDRRTGMSRSRRDRAGDGDYDAAAAHFPLRLDRDQFTIAARVRDGARSPATPTPRALCCAGQSRESASATISA
jgi:hypothetical protein